MISELESKSLQNKEVTIQVRNLVIRFGKALIINNVSFDVLNGEIFCIIGPSGCGKTTLLRSIAGLEEIRDGEISISGKVMTSPKGRIFVQPENRNIGLVFQSYALWPNMNVYDNIAAGLKARKIKGVDERVKEALALVGLSSVERRYPSQLSGGQQQRVALARSLAYRPKVILLDEPLSNLDAKERERVRGELKILLKKIGMTTLYVTHDQEEALTLSDRLAVMNTGEIVQVGSPEEVYEKPVNSFVANFVGKANIFKASLKKMEGTRAVIKIDGLRNDLLCEHVDNETIGDQFYVLFRPNDIVTKSEENVNLLEGEIVSEDYKGNTIDYKVKCDDVSFLLTVPLSSRFETRTGDIMKFFIPPRRILTIKN